MQKIFTTLLCSILFCQLTSAQGPLFPEWNYRYGSVLNDKLNAMIKTADGGFLLGGAIECDTSFDITQPTNGSYDFWIVKLFPNGTKQWEKRYGGDNADILNAMVQTNDGGYLLGGISMSGISGDKTQSCWGAEDFWIVKINSTGGVEWDKRFGNTGDDALNAICKSNDGGYLLAGYSNSSAGGNKTDSAFSQNGDFWMVKINSSGIQQWDKVFGGADYEMANAIIQSSDHSYIVAGFSNSDSSGNKTQNSFGGYDYWLVKTDSSGNKLWDKNYGGSLDDELFAIENSGNAVVLAGWSYSSTSGNKSQDSFGLSDYWILKIDEAGIIQWDRDFGGSNTDDDINSIVKTTDGGYLFSSSSYSPISGNKTEANLGIEQSWLVKINAAGVKEWDKTVFTSGHDEGTFAVEDGDGCYVMGNRCNAQSGGYKTQANYDTVSNSAATMYDFWVIKFCDSTKIHGEGVWLEKATDGVTVYPNPTRGLITVKVEKEIADEVDFILRNQSGEIICIQNEKNISSFYTKYLDLKLLTSGIYFLEINTEGKKWTEKIMKL